MKLTSMLIVAGFAAFAAAGCQKPLTVGSILEVKGSASKWNECVPEIDVLRPEGKTIKLRTALGKFYVLGFVYPPGDKPSFMHPVLCEMAKKLGGKEQVPVVQIIIPTESCPFGPDAVRSLPEPPYNLTLLLDCNKLAWSAFDKPEDGTLILIDVDGRIKSVGNVRNPRQIIIDAYQVGEDWEKIWLTEVVNTGWR